MDEEVLAAMARWPDVPDAHGWLSLDARGRWRLHPEGDAGAGGPGTSISNPGILAFIARNYSHDDQGRWFFQNGPQRVFARLDAAPLILRQDDAAGSLITHTGKPVTQVSRWALDDRHRLYAVTEHGPAMVEDRYLADVLDRLRTPAGQPLLDHPPAWLTDDTAPATPVEVVYPPVGSTPVPFIPLREPASQALGWC
ncbi:hypothetical protein PIGHUM_00608 [Pigmentiphaga humi]|uniref:DUF2946 domain-containing protein n=1 Tax=Pigmentiphaga humi TaxID=2478468 RepID=A0A3P4AYB9_9BURK|nr:DUF2946 family protein [Pigmentiphaga humi]VCU68551.1 hypothetical protein PIGHUM_00608 [Pigmentiphaga humi]